MPQPPTPRVTVYAVAHTLELRSGEYRAKHTTGLPHPHLGLHAPPAPLISPSDSFLLSTLKTGISASKCQLQLGEAGTHQGLPPRQIYRAIKLSLGESRERLWLGRARPAHLALPCLQGPPRVASLAGLRGGPLRGPGRSGFHAAEGHTRMSHMRGTRDGERLVNTCVSCPRVH